MITLFQLIHNDFHCCRDIKPGIININLDQKKGEVNEEDLPETKEMKIQFAENLLASPYPRTDGDFARAQSFETRTQLMEKIEDGLLYKTVIRHGTGKKVCCNDAILFHMNAFTFEYYDEPFDSTFARKRALLSRLHYVLKGYALSLLTMRVGELAEFAIHRSLAYGELGCPPRIPANTDLIAVFEVLEVHSEGSLHYYHSLSKEEQQRELTSDKALSLAHQERINGNNNFYNGEYHKAMLNYKRAIDLLEKNLINQSSVNDCKKLLLSLYQNISNAYLKLNTVNCGSIMVYYSRRAIRIDPRSTKANYQMGLGLIKLGKNEAAKKYILAAHRANPNDVFINQALELLNHKLTIDSISTNNMYKKMSKAILPN